MYELKLHTVHVLGEFITLDHVTAFISSVAPVSQSHISILLWFSCSLICTFCIHVIHLNILKVRQVPVQFTKSNSQSVVLSKSYTARRHIVLQMYRTKEQEPHYMSLYVEIFNSMRHHAKFNKIYHFQHEISKIFAYGSYSTMQGIYIMVPRHLTPRHLTPM